jgi:protein gp37
MQLTTIEWADVTWNPTTGCDRISDGCDNCYALDLAKRLKAMGSPKYQNDGELLTSGPGFGVTEHPDVLEAPFAWKKPRLVFVDSMSDLFHHRISREFIARVWAMMALTPQHTYQVLTKRTPRMRNLLNDPEFMDLVAEHVTYNRDQDQLLSGEWPLPNVWCGTSVEHQLAAEHRIDHLRHTPAAVRFLSCEPLLGPIDLSPWLPWWQTCGACNGILTLESMEPVWQARHRSQRHPGPAPSDIGDLHWVIAGGESGPRARPMRPLWVTGIRDQCTAAGVPFFFKQWGGRVPAAGGRTLDGRTHDDMPKGTRYASTPAPRAHA